MKENLSSTSVLLCVLFLCLILHISRGTEYKGVKGFSFSELRKRTADRIKSKLELQKHEGGGIYGQSEGRIASS